MSSWSSRRKSLYGLGTIVAVVVVIGIPVFLLWYKAPSCFDSIQNGDEKGRDCGGSCLKLCQTDFLPPRIVWGGAKFEKVAPSLYNVAAYIENQNITAAAVNVPYKITLYDTQGNFIVEKQGIIDIPPHRNTIVFNGAVNVGQRTPAKATFEFMRAPIWFKSHDTLDALSIGKKDYQEDDKNSSLQVTLKNTALTPYTDVQVGVVLYDINNNAIGFSKTVLDQVSPNGGQEIAPFTWPVSRQGRVTSIEVLPVVDSPRDR